jgi:hypothetical protein
MRRPPEIEIIRKAYELWEQSGKPEGRDQEFYLQALQGLQTLLENDAPNDDEQILHLIAWMTLRTVPENWRSSGIGDDPRDRAC